MLAQAGTQSTQAAARHIGGIRIDHLPHQVGVLTQLRPAAGVCHRGADHGITVANDILRASLNRDIHSERQRVKQHARRPGVIQHDNCFGRFGAHGRHNGRDILHFHRYRRRRFQKHHAGIGLHQFTDLTADAVIKPGGGDLHFGEDFGAEILRGFVNRSAHQYVIARFNKRQNGVGNGGCAAGIECTARAPFQFGHGILQRKVRERAATAIKEFAFGTPGGGALFIRDGVKNQG